MHLADVGAVGEQLATGAEAVASLAGDQERQVLRVVSLAVSHVRTEEDDGIVEHAAAGLAHTLQPIEEVGILLDEEGVDLGIHRQGGSPISMVGDRVVIPVDPLEEGHVPGVEAVTEHEGGGTGRIAPEGQRLHVHHQATVGTVGNGKRH